MRWPLTKSELCAIGQEHIKVFCELNGISLPAINVISRGDWMVSACAYYRPDTPFVRKWTTPGINICLELCQQPCSEEPSRNWTWPGNTADREPYGVLAHELGHHCDWLSSVKKGTYFGDYSASIRARSKEAPITNYCDGDHEWFAEMFRVFFTNPDLLRHLRPATSMILLEHWKPLPAVTWREALGENCPARVIHSLINKGAR